MYTSMKRKSVIRRFRRWTQISKTEEFLYRMNRIGRISTH